MHLPATFSSTDAPASVGGTPKKGITRMARSRVQRRNTMDCALLNEMFVNDESKRTDKRLQSLLRDSEREMKNSLAAAAAVVSTVGTSTLASAMAPPRGNSFHEGAHPLESLDKIMPLSSDMTAPLRIASKVVESCNRYRCVSSRPIGCRSSAPPLAFTPQLPALGGQVESNKSTPGLEKRKNFHETFANLIKLGSVDRQDAKLSQEEHTWQTELKDLIWLELQAWQADRTVEQQDKYLYEARQGVSDLLAQIINYKFQPRYRREPSLLSLDSGIQSDANSNASCKC